MTITSPQNPRLKDLRRLHRRREREHSGRFFVEGEDLVQAAESAGCPAIEGYRVAGSDLGGDGFQDVRPDALAAASTLGSGTRVIGVYEQRWLARPQGPRCVYLHGLSDPGNVGTALRSAHAFAASCVALGPGCADPYSPKAVRASMGAIFQMAITRVTNIDELPGELVALVPGGGSALRDLDLPAALTLLIGAERDGLPAQVTAACDHVCHIPIASQSLNAAMAMTVALYELARDHPPEPS